MHLHVNLLIIRQLFSFGQLVIHVFCLGFEGHALVLYHQRRAIDTYCHPQELHHIRKYLDERRFPAQYLNTSLVGTTPS